jgi:hypothetical protein
LGEYVCTNVENERNGPATNADRQRRFRQSSKGIAAAAARNANAKKSRREAREQRRSGLAMVFDGRVVGQLREVWLSVPTGTAGLVGWVEEVSFE